MIHAITHTPSNREPCPSVSCDCDAVVVDESRRYHADESSLPCNVVLSPFVHAAAVSVVTVVVVKRRYSCGRVRGGGGGDVECRGEGRGRRRVWGAFVADVASPSTSTRANDRPDGPGCSSESPRWVYRRLLLLLPLRRTTCQIPAQCTAPTLSAQTRAAVAPSRRSHRNLRSDAVLTASTRSVSVVGIVSSAVSCERSS